MSEDPNKNKSLELIIGEQQRDYDYLLHIYNRMRATEALLLTATVGIATFLYKDNVGTASGIAGRLSVPPEDYGKVICFMAMGFFVYGLCKLMLNVFGYNPWMTTYEAPKTDYAYREGETREYIKKRDDECLGFNGKCYAKRKRELIFLFYCIALSAIILVVIKTLE